MVLLAATLVVLGTRITWIRVCFFNLLCSFLDCSRHLPSSCIVILVVPFHSCSFVERRPISPFFSATATSTSTATASYYAAPSSSFSSSYLPSILIVNIIPLPHTYITSTPRRSQIEERKKEDRKKEREN